MKKSITVFTPTYNRQELLVHGYNALKNQTSKDFEWLIIDDGSTDETEKVVKGWINEKNDFVIRYIKKGNGGLHTGYNCAIENAQTELMVCVDSDDYMPNDAVETILEFWKQNGSNDYAGIVALDCDLSGNVIGDKLPNEKSINLIDLLLEKYQIRNGDRTNVIRTDVYREVAPMKSFNGEKNFNPHYMHLQISKKYDFLVLNKCLKVVEYQPGGMTDSIFKQYYNSPNSYIELRKFNLSLDNASLLFKCKNAVHYVSSCFLAGRKHIISDCPKKILCALCILPGFIFSKYITYKNKDKK